MCVIGRLEIQNWGCFHFGGTDMVRKAEKKYLETLASIAIILKTVVFDLRYPGKSCRTISSNVKK